MLKYFVLFSLLLPSVAHLDAQGQTDSAAVPVDKVQRRAQEALARQVETLGTGLNLSGSQQAAIVAVLAQMQMEINNVNESSLGKAKLQARQLFTDTAVRQIRQQLSAAQQNQMDVKHPNLAAILLVR